jgi:mannose-6-phosphate isomerase-like protein (cupin superfamily)
MEPYTLNDGEGRSYLWYNFLFTMKAGPSETGAFAVMDFATRKGEEPPEHVHEGEDELFYILDGNLTFTCGDRSFDVGPRGFVFVPAIYRIHLPSTLGASRACWSSRIRISSVKPLRRPAR